MPTTAQLVAAAVAVREALNGHAFSQTFTAERSYADWHLKLSDAGTLHVDVVPVRPTRNELDGRASLDYDLAVDVGIRFRFDSDEEDEATGRVDLAEVDALVLLVEEINEFFVANRQGDDEQFAWKGAEVLQAFSPKQLREWRQFFGLVRLTLETSKELPS